MRKLREEQIVKLMFPSFDEDKRALPEGAQACTGAAVFDDAVFKSGQLLRRKPWPFIEQEGDLTYGSGGDRLKVVWLRTHEFADGSHAGPLAVIRSGERIAELFAIGVLKSAPERTRLGTARMGADFVVTAESDGCTGRAQGVDCETVTRIYLPRHGSLTELAAVPVERTAYSGRGERGASGVLEYRLSTTLEYRDASIRLLEQVRIKDDTGRELRKAEHERLLGVDENGHVTESEPSLWDQIVKTEEPGRPENRDAPSPRRR